MALTNELRMLLVTRGSFGQVRLAAEKRVEVQREIFLVLIE